MKNRKKTKKIINLSLIASSAMFLVPSFIVSCSASQISKSNQSLIDKQYELFFNSLVLQENNDIYFQNFNFQNFNNNDSDMSAVLSLEEIGSFLAIPPLSNSFDYVFLVRKNSNSEIAIEMKMKLKDSSDSNLLPSNLSYSIKKISNIKNYSLTEMTQFANCYKEWFDNGAKLLEIKNNQTNKVLDSLNYKEVLPSYLTLSNISFDYKLTFFDALSPYKCSIENNFNDIEGKIESNMKIVDKNTGYVIYTDNYNQYKKIIIEGFANQKTRNEEINTMYSKLSQTLYIDNLTSQKEIPFLASGITTIDDVKNLISTLYKISNEAKLKDILDILDFQNSWYSISITSTATDTIGNLVVDYTIVDNFSGYRNRPSNITKLGTFNNLIKLQIVNEDGTKDSSKLNNVYQVYNKLKTLNLTNQKNNLQVDEVVVTSLSNQWLLNETNIINLLPDIKLVGEYLEFSYQTNTTISKFRFKLDQNLIKPEEFKKDVILGVLEFPILLEIELEGDFDTNISGNEKQWVKVLPPSGISSSTSGESFNSAARESQIKIGGFLTNNINDTTIFYNHFKGNSVINVNIENENYFYTLLNACSHDESQILELLSLEIKQAILLSFSSSKDYQTIEKLLNKHKIDFGFIKNKDVSYDQINMSFSSIAPIKLVNQSESNYLEIPFYQNGLEQAFPSVIIKIKHVKNL